LTYLSATASRGSQDVQSSPSDAVNSWDNSTPEAQALVAGGGQTKRTNPLTYNGGLERVRKPIRRGGGFLYGVDLHGKKKGKKGSISTIFQSSVTALAFLAFGGYLMCLIVQAVRAKNNGMAMMNGAALHANPSRYTFIGRRPAFGKRRKRDSSETDKPAGHLNSNSVEEMPTKIKHDGHELIDERVLEALITDYGDKPDNQQTVTKGMQMTGTEEETNKVLMKTINSNATQKSSEGLEGNEFNKMQTGCQSDETTLQTVEDDEFETDTTKHTQHGNAYREDEMKLGHWPLANIEDMYRALVMISEGYSLYHQTAHRV
jgi:hypothetical protein